MSIVALLIALVGFAVVGVFIAAPLFERARHPEAADADAPSVQRAELTATYERIKTTLRDLDEDHALGKLDDASYRVEREHWLTEGARVLAALDAITE